MMIDKNDWDAITDAVRRHPHYLGGVIFSTEDVFDECESMGIDPTIVDMGKFDFRGWEMCATEDGWPVITEELANYEPEEA